MTLTQKIVASSVLPIIKILAIENHKLDNTFLDITFRSQSLLKSTSDQIGSDINWRTEEGDQRSGWMRVIQNSSRELNLYPKINPTRLSSSLAKTT
jgi:hypothetical protein